MKRISYISVSLIILLTCSGFVVHAQRRNVELTPASLSAELTAKCTNDMEKMKAIFQWIIDNISYNVIAISRNKNPYLIYEEPDDTSRVLKPLNERVAETILRRRTAVCDGYARLFKSLCDHAGIHSEVITGYARAGGGRAKFGSNHKWNAVLIDSSWYLLDATWASGYISRGSEFIKFYDPRYFMPSPREFIYDHYPEDVKWTLLKEPPTLSEFSHTPFHYMGFLKEKVTSYLPAKGLIEAAIGDTLKFVVEVSGDRNDLYVSAYPPVEFDDDEPPPMTGKRRVGCTYIVTSDPTGWLYVICNGEAVLRYKLNIKGTDNGTAGLLPK